MLPQRFVPSQSSAVRKSRLGDGKPSMLPKPRRPGSTDRLSSEARRPSAAGHRSSSAEPSRSTLGGTRLSREASATKLPINSRSRSQQGDRFGQSSMTPMRSSQYSARPTTTPQRTPSEDRRTRSWQTSLDRALAFVTIKDQRPTTAVAWQRGEIARVQEALAMRGGGGGVSGGNMALVRPLTIARFVEIVGALLAVITRDTKLNNDNYVAKLPHLSKRVLYPGAVSKSWLKTVNTLHAFPHALALVAYLLDLVIHIETPVDDDNLYTEKDEISCLRREYLDACWKRFQEPGYQFVDLNEEYLRNLESLLGNDEEKIAELKQIIKKYETCLEDETVKAELAEEARLLERRDGLLNALREERAARRATRAEHDAELARKADLAETARSVEGEIEKANTESQQLKLELEKQTMSVAERTRLLDEVDYALRVQDSKRALADQITKMVHSKETELALWQKKTLDSCVEYKQGLIHLSSAQFPHLANLAIDEKELMGQECAHSVSQAVEALRECSAALAERRTEHARSRTALARKRTALLDETRTKITEMKLCIQREQEALDTEVDQEGASSGACSRALQDARDKLQALDAAQRSYALVQQELDHWETQHLKWSTKLAAMQEYIKSKHAESQRLLAEACARRSQLLLDTVSELNKAIDN